MAVDKRARRLVIKALQAIIALRAAYLVLNQSKSISEEDRKAFTDAFWESSKHIDEALALLDEPEDG